MKKLGRPKGAVNKRSALVRERLEKLGCDPIEGLAYFAMGDVVKLGMMTAAELKKPGNDFGRKSGKERAAELIPPALRYSAYAELAHYCEAKLKHIDVSSNDGTGLPSVVFYIPDDGRDPKPAGSKDDEDGEP